MGIILVFWIHYTNLNVTFLRAGANYEHRDKMF